MGKKETELRNLLANISDTYEDFVNGVMIRAKKYNLTDKLIDLINKSEDITTSQVICAISDMRGIKKVCTE